MSCTDAADAKRDNDNDEEEEEEKIEAYPLRITNTVHTAHLMRVYPLPAVAEALYGRYDSNVFPAATCNMREPHAVPQLFHKGRVVVPGPPCHMQALLCAYLLAYRIQKTLGVYGAIHNFGCHNMVASFSVGYQLNLDLFTFDHRVCKDGSICNYSPQNFPGANFFMATPVKLEFSIYKTGRVVVVGARSFAQLQQGVALVMEKLPRYRLRAEYRVLAPEHYRSRASPE